MSHTICHMSRPVDYVGTVPLSYTTNSKTQPTEVVLLYNSPTELHESEWYELIGTTCDM